MSSNLAFRKIVLGLALLPFVGIPVVSVVAWHHCDTQIPNDDAGQYTKTAADIYRPLADGKPFRFVRNLYLKRGFRPVTLPCFAALCLPVAHGDLKTATALTLCSFYALLYGYSFLLLRLSTTISAAAFGAAVVATLPWILQYSAVFFADVPMVAVMVAALYHAQRCENWTSLPHSAALGFALALAISLRPIEPLPAVVVLLTLLLISSFVSGRITLCDVRLVSVPLVALLVLLVLCTLSILRSKLLAAGLFCPAIGMYGRLVSRSRAPLNHCFAATVATLFLGIGLWYLPAASETWNWVWSCSFGDLNRLYKGVGELGFRDAVYLIGTNLGGIQLAVVAALAGVALVTSACTGHVAIPSWEGVKRFCSVAWGRAQRAPAIKASATLPTESRPRLFRIGSLPAMPGALILTAGLVQVLLVVSLAAVTPGTDLRRGFVGFYWAFLGLMIYATSPLLKWHRLRTIALGALAATQLTTVTFSAIGHVPVALEPTAAITRAVYPAPQRWKDKTLRTFDEVLNRVPAPCDIAAMTVAINAYSERVFDLSALGALSSVKKSTVRFGCPCIFETLADGYRQLENYSFVLLDTRAVFSTIPPHKRREPYSMLSEDLASRYQQNRLSDVGLKARATFEIDDVKVVILEWVSTPTMAHRAASHAR